MSAEHTQDELQRVLQPLRKLLQATWCVHPLTWAALRSGRFRLRHNLPQLPHPPGILSDAVAQPEHQSHSVNQTHFWGKSMSAFRKSLHPPCSFQKMCSRSSVMWQCWQPYAAVACNSGVCMCSRSPPAAPAANGALAGQPGQLQRAEPGSGSSNSGSQSFTPKVISFSFCKAFMRSSRSALAACCVSQRRQHVLTLLKCITIWTGAVRQTYDPCVLARWLQALSRVHSPGLPLHPQAELTPLHWVRPRPHLLCPQSICDACMLCSGPCWELLLCPACSLGGIVLGLHLLNDQSYSAAEFSFLHAHL